MALTGRPEQQRPATSEAAYDRLSRYRFAQRYVEGKTVADIGWEEVGYGSRLLAETAESVTGLTGSSGAVDLATTEFSAPNVNYREVSLPDLPYPDRHFDVVVTFGVVENLEQPEEFVREAKRILKPTGVLVLSASDKKAHLDERGGRAMYVPEFRDLLESLFGYVRLYRQGAVAGGFVFPASEEVTDTAIESARFAPTGPHFTPEPPTTGSVIGVCSGVEDFGREGRPYLLLDRDRRIYEERDDCAEDVELLRGEIHRMQATEAQASHDALRLYSTEIAYLRAQLRRAKAQERRAKAQEHALRMRVREIETSTTWRVFNPYRRLRAKLGDLKTITHQSAEGSGDPRER